MYLNAFCKAGVSVGIVDQTSTWCIATKRLTLYPSGCTRRNGQIFALLAAEHRAPALSALTVSDWQPCCLLCVCVCPWQGPSCTPAFKGSARQQQTLTWARQHRQHQQQQQQQMRAERKGKTPFPAPGRFSPFCCLPGPLRKQCLLLRRRPLDATPNS